MSRRKTVKLNLEFVNPRIKQIFRSNVVFCEKMGRAHNWVTDWNRVNKGTGEWEPKNLPSPEEAAKMCLLLKAEPEEILHGVGATDEETAKLQADIETVRKLVEAERAKESAPDLKIEGMDDNTAKIVDFIKSASVEELAEVCRYIAYLESKREDKS